MPTAPRFTSSLVEELFRQLRYTPPETLRRQMAAAEQFIAEIRTDDLYEWTAVVQRITGFRRDGDDGDTKVVGRALLADLAALIQRMSVVAPLAPHRDGAPAMSLTAVGERLGVSSKTVQRYRRLGLVCHYVHGTDGSVRLSCFRDAVERFERRHPKYRTAANIERFTRLGRAQREAIVNQARVMKRSDPRLSLNQAALRIAPRFDRAHETIRSILNRHDRTAATPIFNERGPLTRRDRNAIHRAWRRGVTPAVLGRRYGRSVPTILRSINIVRRRLLKDLELRAFHLPTFDRPDAEDVILSTPVVLGGPGDPLGDDLLALLEAAHEAPEIAEREEAALVAGYNLLKRRAAAAIDALPAYPTGQALDAIEVDLMWAAGLKRRLVALAFPVAVRRIEQFLHRRLSTDPGEHVLRLSHMVLRVIDRVVEELDPTRDMHLARRTAYAVDRALAATGDTSGSTRAAARHQPGSLRLHRSERMFCPWESWLDTRADLIPAAASLDSSTRTLLVQRFGWDGGRPHTLDELAEIHGSTAVAVARRVRTGLLEARQNATEAGA